MLDVTTFGIIAGAVIGLPLLLFARIVGGTELFDVRTRLQAAIRFA